MTFRREPYAIDARDRRPHGAVACTRLLNTLLFGVDAVSPAVFAAVPVMMILVGMLASYVPACRASRVNPITSLRLE